LCTFTVCDLFNLTLRPGLIMPQTFDDSLFVDGDGSLDLSCPIRANQLNSSV